MTKIAEKLGRNFPRDARRIDQVAWLLSKKESMTVWEIFDALKPHGVFTQHRTIFKALKDLRDQGRAGIVNYKQEERRFKRDSEHWGYNKHTAGESTGDWGSAGIWMIFNEG